ncbi:cytochrome P450 [Lentithecium fluviatile CBS 122367]|uniref:Cytochrome P450 n=1 Tax=Lentithecium fluviatile CBS 122367 TaxID=1168545 RepID=A0A6G1JF42_9PLEO|nr:cytochrome P450 [Lentithecium fluviatile CBS 122367]
MIIAFLALGAFLLSLVVYYRLFLHPLAKYPGPVLARLTDWYNVYHCFKGDRHIDFVRLHNRYGKFVRYGPNRLSINSAGALKSIYGAHANTKKADFYEAMQFYMDIPSTHCTVEKEQHSRKRRILSQAFSDKMLYAYEPLFVKTLEKYLTRYEKAGDSWSEEYDMNHEFSLFVFDAMGGFCFGEPFGALDDPKKADIVPPTFEGFQGLNVVGHMHGIAMLHLDSLQPRLKKAIEDYKAYSAQLAHECIEKSMKSEKKDPTCVFDVLLDGYKQKGSDAPSIPELESESSLLVLAGSDSTANSMSNVIFNLLNNPPTLARLTTEVRSKFTSASEIRLGPTLNECEYLFACIDESMRVTPVIGGVTQRVTLTGGIEIDGCHIPAGTDVGVPHHAIMRNEDYFEDPWTFEPRRWLTSENTKEAIRTARSAFYPLGLGLTECIGKKWALIEIKLTVARMVYLYDLELVIPEDQKHLSPIDRVHIREAEATDRFTVGSKGPWVRFRRAK